MREKGLAGEISALKEFMTGAGVVPSQALGLVRPPGESDAKLLLLHLLVGVSGQLQQGLPCQSVIRARVGIETNFLIGL